MSMVAGFATESTSVASMPVNSPAAGMRREANEWMPDMTHPVTEHHAELNGGRVRYYRAGEFGPAIVLLHGGGLDTAQISWKHAINALSPHYKVYAPDWPKHGGSQGWSAFIDQQQLETCLADLFAHWDIRRATLVGLSMGGSAALGFTLNHPEMVSRLILVDSGGLQERAPHPLSTYLLMRMPFILRLTTKRLTKKSNLRQSIEKKLFKRPVADIEEIVEAVAGELAKREMVLSDWMLDELRSGLKLKTNHMPRLSEVRCPALIVHGTADDLVPVSIARAAAARIAHAELQEMKGYGHWPNREDPAAFNDLLLEFLRRTDNR